LLQIPNLTTCPSSPAAREFISAAIPFDLLRKRKPLCKKQMLVMVRQRWTRW
jgi:hypothetical protein